MDGGIKFGEYSQDTILREVKEEIDSEAGELAYLSMLENIFTFDGEPGHEIVQVDDGALKESGLYEQSENSGHEGM